MIKFMVKDSNKEARAIALSVRYVLRAISKDPVKPVFTKLFSDGENIVASDSNRLHLAPVKIPAGLYDVIKNTAQEIIITESDLDAQFPDYKRVVPSGRPDPVALADYDAKYSGGARCIFQLFSAGVCINTHFIEDACKDNCGAKASIAGEKEPVVISSDLGTAVIMPIKTRGKAE